MNEPTASPTWAEYLAAASAHLRAVRTTAERGARPPAPPAHPVGLIPDELLYSAQRMADGYLLLAEEVAARMSQIEQRRPSSTRLHGHYEQRHPLYIDTPA
jgi:hypothetical protein